MLNFLCVFLCNSLHEMNCYPSKQTNTAPALHIYSQWRARDYSAFKAEVLSVFLSSTGVDFFFHVPLVFLNQSLKNSGAVKFYDTKETKGKPKGRK